MAQVVRERAARLFDSLDEMRGDVPLRVRGNVNSRRTYQGVSGASVTKKRRKVSKVGSDISARSGDSPNVPPPAEDTHTAGKSKIGPKRLNFNEKTGDTASAGSILDAVLNEQPASSLYTTSKNVGLRNATRGLEESSELLPPWAGDSLLFQ